MFLATGQNGHSADQSQVILDIATKLYTLDVILEYRLFSTAIKLNSLDVILEYSKARIREEKVSTEQENSSISTEMVLRPPVYCDAHSNIC